MVHGICQSCRILVAEADQDTPTDFAKTIGSAAAAGATVIVTTYAAPESPDEDSALSGPTSATRAAVVAAVGDATNGTYGYTGGLNVPAALPSVLAVGGTTLTYGRVGRPAESAWAGTVTGCGFEYAPTWQTRIEAISGCSGQRVDADVAAVAEPGAIIHVSGADQAGGPWYVADGTSLSAPVIGAVIGLAGSAGANEAQMLYARELSDPFAFHDILTGENSGVCRAAICMAGRGWDAPTGLGTPNGLEAFLPAGPTVSRSHPAVTVSGPRGGVAVSHRWRLALTIANRNAFRVSGTITLERSLRSHGRTRHGAVRHRGPDPRLTGHGRGDPDRARGGPFRARRGPAADRAGGPAGAWCDRAGGDGDAGPDAAGPLTGRRQSS